MSTLYAVVLESGGTLIGETLGGMGCFSTAFTDRGKAEEVAARYARGGGAYLVVELHPVSRYTSTVERQAVPAPAVENRN